MSVMGSALSNWQTVLVHIKHTHRGNLPVMVSYPVTDVAKTSTTGQTIVYPAVSLTEWSHILPVCHNWR